ncbi:MAG TPA: menaquinone reductase integral membrane subunit QrcD [Desulfatiglandales bacterium]|nr:menaquinone reductase integral membrane subunit QrcD [Desulfatiglandales bacterium]
MDLALIPNGVRRCSLKTFAPWMLLWLALIAWGLVSALLCLYKGLNQTNMNHYFAFGLWIVFDLSVIALGAGAFFTGFLTHVIGKAFIPSCVEDLKAVINAAVVIGFICYSSAIAMLGVDIGQPIRGWFIFWHANVHSMLTEVSFCITVYLSVLTIEYLPIIFSNRKLKEIPEIDIFGNNLHHIVALFAAAGAFLSFFHQGSLGGMYGVLFGRPFAFREGLFIWPWTFFLFILSAIAAGPSFTMLCIWITQKVTGKELVKRSSFALLAKISGWLLTTYIILKIIDTISWAYGVVPRAGLSFMDFYREPYGLWLFIAEIGIFGIIPAIILITPRFREKDGLLIIGALMNVTGIVLNRFVFTIQTLAIPVMPFDKFMTYFPTWQEWGIAVGALGYGILLFSLSYRYLPLFPQEVELNPIAVSGNTAKDF